MSHRRTWHANSGYRAQSTGTVRGNVNTAANLDEWPSSPSQVQPIIPNRLRAPDESNPDQRATAHMPKMQDYNQANGIAGRAADCQDPKAIRAVTFGQAGRLHEARVRATQGAWGVSTSGPRRRPHQSAPRRRRVQIPLLMSWFQGAFASPGPTLRRQRLNQLTNGNFTVDYWDIRRGGSFIEFCKNMIDQLNATSAAVRCVRTILPDRCYRYTFTIASVFSKTDRSIKKEASEIGWTAEQ